MEEEDIEYRRRVALEAACKKWEGQTVSVQQLLEWADAFEDYLKEGYRGG